MSDLLGAAGATFSPCRRYRTLLWRDWGPGSCLLFIGLNPSTADESVNDPTVERVQRRALMGSDFRRLEVCNLFSFRATDPREMMSADDPVGLDNDVTIMAAAMRSRAVLCGWGTHGHHLGRGRKVEAMLRRAGIPLMMLRMTKCGMPGHPLYVPYSQGLQPWK